MKFFLVIATVFLACLDQGLAKDPSCGYPLLDEPAEVNADTCARLLEEPYHDKFIDYVCYKSCSLKKCLDEFETVRSEPAFEEAFRRVESTTAVYPKEHRSELCGNFDPKPPGIETDDDVRWNQYRDFVDARKKINNLLKFRIKNSKDTCIRKDNTKGSFMRFKRALRLHELLTKCDALHGKNGGL